MADMPLQAVVYASYKSGSTTLFQAIRSRMAGEVHEIFEPASLEVLDGPFSAALCAKIITHLKLDWAHMRRQMPRLFPIALVRDPRDVLVSALFFRPQEKSLDTWRDVEALNALHARLLTKLDRPTSTSLLDVFEHPYTEEVISAWMTTTYGRLESAIEAGAREVRYDDLVENRLGDLWDEMGLPASPLAEDDRWPHVPRSKRSGNWRRWLTEADVEWLRGVVDPVLARWPWMPEDWTLHESPELSESEGIDYIRRTVNMTRAQAGLSAWQIQG